MVAMVALIGTRVDFYAMLHAIWLLAMFAMKREHIARLWTAYTAFIIVCIIIQYIMIVDVPPSLCVGVYCACNEKCQPTLNISSYRTFHCFRLSLGYVRHSERTSGVDVFTRPQQQTGDRQNSM